MNPIIELSNKISCAIDNRKDRKICGMELGRFVPTPYAESHGATGSQSAPYIGLDKILKGLYLTREDSFIDIGCGKGRVISYMVSRGFPCKLTGIEINPDVAKVALKWTSRYPNVEIIEGDAFGLDYNDYTVLFMYRPMETFTFKMFIELLESTLTHEIKLYYYVDEQSGYYLNDRPGWTLLTRQKMFFVKGLFIHKEPQRYSVWTYSPVSIDS